MKNSIGKPYEGKLHVRFDEGGADSLLIIATFRSNNGSKLSGSTLRKNYNQQHHTYETKNFNLFDFWINLNKRDEPIT